MTDFHVLNGDALKEQTQDFLNPNNVSVARECLMEGPVANNTFPQFWLERETFLNNFFGKQEDPYFDKVVPEFERIANLKEPHNIYLWFEYDLFCQVNFWFSLFWINKQNRPHKLFWVRPENKDWKGFGNNSSEELKELKGRAFQLSEVDFSFFLNCWKAYQQNDKSEFESLIKLAPLEFQFLNNVVTAHFERLPKRCELTRPEKSLLQISNTLNSKKFTEVFRIFSVQEGIYGYGDLQVKKIWDKLIQNHKTLFL